jgi:hypothetical protein
MRNQIDPRELWELHKNGGGTMTWKEVGERFGLSRDTVKNMAIRWADEVGLRPDKSDDKQPIQTRLEVEEPVHPVLASGVEVKGDIVFEDKKPEPTDADIQALLDAYLNLQDKAKKLNTQQDEATVKLGDGLPSAIVYLCDPHLGSWGWASRRQLEDIRLISETEGLFTVLLGDEWDNFIFNFGKWANMMPPEHQRKITHYVYKKLIQSTVATVGGNHLAWTEKAAGIDLNAELAQKMKAIFLGTRGDLHVKVGNEKYHLHMRHMARGYSTVNKTNSARVASNEIGGADVIVEGDKHEPWLETTYQARKRQTWLRCGTFKVNDPYTSELDFEQGKVDMPLTIFMPDTHRVISYMDFRDGLLHLKALRDEYRKREASAS